MTSIQQLHETPYLSTVPDISTLKPRQYHVPAVEVVKNRRYFHSPVPVSGNQAWPYANPKTESPSQRFELQVVNEPFEKLRVVPHFARHDSPEPLVVLGPDVLQIRILPQVLEDGIPPDPGRNLMSTPHVGLIGPKSLYQVK